MDNAIVPIQISTGFYRQKSTPANCYVDLQTFSLTKCSCWLDHHNTISKITDSSHFTKPIHRLFFLMIRSRHQLRAQPDISCASGVRNLAGSDTNDHDKAKDDDDHQVEGDDYLLESLALQTHCIHALECIDCVDAQHVCTSKI